MSYKNIITTIVPKYRLSRQFYLQAGIFKYRFSMMIIVKDEFGKGKRQRYCQRNGVEYPSEAYKF